jgi:peptidoglycan/LPS O-acetylase OafA/YrhL
MAPWLIFIMYVAAFRGRLINSVVRNLWITTIGGMCYSIYLLHNYGIAASGFVVGQIGVVLPFEVRLLVQFLLITPVVLAVSALFFRLVERPCMQPDWPSVLMARARRVLRLG